MPYISAQRSSRRSRTLAGIIFLALACLGWWAWVPATFSDPACHLDTNAAWIGVEWTSTPIDQEAVAELAQQAQDQQLRFLYPFTTYLKADGTRSPSYSHASPFVNAFRQYNQHTAVLAWVGLPYQHIDFSEPQKRAQTIAFLTKLTAEAGFNGLHINAEPIPNGEPSYLQFLQELRAALSPNSMLSVASLPWASAGETVLAPSNPYRWSSAYYRAIASSVDQIAVMAYDSHAPTAALYRLWMREQVVGISRGLADTPVSVLIGISVSREVTDSHRPAVESLPHGLAGLCAALHRNQVDQIEGVALYALWEADATDWQAWQAWQQDNQ